MPPTTGRDAVVGLLTLTPYDYWRRTHAVHHATSGNLNSRGMGDVDTLTVRGIRRAVLVGCRLRFRLYRHPAVMFGLGPIFRASVCSIGCQSGLMNKPTPFPR